MQSHPFDILQLETGAFIFTLALAQKALAYHSLLLI